MFVTTLPTADNLTDEPITVNPTKSTASGSLAQPILQLRNIYWRKLLQVGIPSSEAKLIAEAIANFDTRQQIPTGQQKQLIGHYCTFIAQARLWRLELLIGDRKIGR
jgi:hypothetical protein